MAAETNPVSTRLWSFGRRPDVVAAVVVCLPIAWAAIRAAFGSWVPVGDDAYFTLRSLDVGTEHHPLLGAWTSASVDLESSVNNLGPLQLDLLAPFTRVEPYGGTAVAVATIQIATICTITWLLRRLAGAGGAVAGLVPVALLCWTMGSELLITPRQHQLLVLPYLLVLVAAWASAAGDRWAAVPFVAAGSLTMQTHLSYPVLVGLLGLLVIAGQVLAARRSGDAASYRRPWSIAVGLGVVLWVQTAIDQLFGWGNFTAVLTSPGETERPGWWRGLQIVGSVVGDPTRHLRGGFPSFNPDLAMSDVAAVGVIAVVIAIAAGLVAARRGGHRLATAGLATALVALGAAVLDAALLPVTVFGLQAGNYRWLWSTVTFIAIGGCMALHRVLVVRKVLDPQRVLLGAGAVLFVLAVINLPRSVQTPFPERYVDDQVAVADVVEQLDRVSLEGPVVIDQRQMYFGHPYGYPVALALNERGIEYRFISDVQERRFGAARVADGTEPTTLVLLGDDLAEAVRGGSTTVVYSDVFRPMAIVIER